MNIKNKKKGEMIGAMLISASVITACGAGNTANAFQNAGTEEIAQLGSILDQNPVFQEDAEEALYAAGDHIVITQAEMDWKIRANKYYGLYCSNELRLNLL